MHRFEPKLGGQVELSVEIGGKRHYFGGAVLVFEREREVTFESNWQGSDAWPVPTFFTLRPTPLYDGTIVEFFHHASNGSERMRPTASRATRMVGTLGT